MKAAIAYVLDASVAVAALRNTEVSHARALARCMPLFAGRERIEVPAIFDVEVTAALVRRGADPQAISQVLSKHFASRTLVTLGPRAASKVCAIATRTRLRAADAFYVWVAARHALHLVTLDREVLERAALVGVTAVEP